MTVWQEDAARDLVLNAGERLALLVRGEGSYLWDADGRRHLDFLAGIAVTSLGHAHPAFVKAVSTQSARVPAVPSTASRIRPTPDRLTSNALAGSPFFREPLRHNTWPLP